MKVHESDNRIIHGGVFILFCAIIVAATLYYSPWWGVMDDSRNLAIAADFWKHPSIGLICNHIKGFIDGLGRFMPLYHFWIVIAYGIFSNFPIGLYLSMALVCFVTLLVWGRIINKIFPNQKSASFNLFVYPLSFFIFTPFWNNFMYISILEKFVYIFATFSLYFYLRAYETNRIAYLVVSFTFMILGILSKETGIALAGVFFMYSLLDYLVFHKNKKFSLIGLAGNAVILIGFYLLVSSIWSGIYSAGYKNNFNCLSMLKSVLSAPLVIKGLVVTALIFACLGKVLITRKKSGFIRQEYILFPFLLGMYLIILSPWGFMNYLLAPIAPFVMMTLYPVFMFIGAGSIARRKALEGILIILIFFVLFLIIVPRISKMGDTKTIVSAIISMRDGSSVPVKFFMAPPFAETPVHIEAYTNTSITYLNTGLLDKDMLKDGAVNYIIFEDRCSPVTLRDVVVEKEVYHNETWRVFSLKRAIGKTQSLVSIFEKNLLQRIKDWIKAVR